MSAEILLELRQQSKNANNINNSEFQVNLPVQKLNKNDSIQLHSVYVDTIEENTGKIVIDETNQEFSLDYGIYVQDGPMGRATAASAKQYYAPEAASDADALLTRPNAKNYILSSADPSSGGGVDMVEISSFILKSDIDNNRFARDTYMGIHLQYYDASNTLRSWYGEIKASTWADHIAKNGEQEGQEFIMNNQTPWHTDYGFPIIARKNGFGTNDFLRANPANNKQFHDAKITFGGVDPTAVTDLTTNTIYTPMSFNLSIVLDVGTYQPQDLLKEITDKLNNAVNNNSQIPNNQYSFNNLTRSLVQLIDYGDRQVSTPASQGNTPFFVAQDASDVLQFKIPANNGNKNYLFGTNGIAMGFDNEGYASFDILHLSRYNGSSKAVNQFQVDGKKLVFNKVSGIYFIDSNASTYDLLVNKLNFSPRIFSKIIGAEHKSIGALANSTFQQYDIVNSVNATGEAIFNDSLINKSSDPSLVCFDEAITFPAPSNNPPQGQGSVLTNQQATIRGVAPVTDYTDREGFIAYYQLELSSSFSLSKITDGQNSRKIMAIISKYYSSLNYTVGDGSNSVVYVHQEDEPLLIDSFGVRILDPDGNNTDDKINDDNTVFLKIVRGNI